MLPPAGTQGIKHTTNIAPANHGGCGVMPESSMTAGEWAAEQISTIDAAKREMCQLG